jgi:hypothetical protein
MTHKTAVEIIGTGSFISAIKGANIVVDLPTTLLTPITKPRKAD